MHKNKTTYRSNATKQCYEHRHRTRNDYSGHKTAVKNIVANKHRGQKMWVKKKTPSYYQL